MGSMTSVVMLDLDFDEMTEHCVNFDTSQCQTEDATHLILTYNQFKANKTIGHTYSGERADLAFHLAADPEAPIYRLKLIVVNPTDRTWNVLLYENPHDYTSASSITTLAAKSELELYTLREYEFSKNEEVLVFFRFGDKLFDVEQVELQRLWQCLNNLHEQQMFADMIISNDAGDQIPAHRAVIAAASQTLQSSVSSLEPIELEEGTQDNTEEDTEEDTANNSVADSNDNDDLEEAFVAFANAVVKVENPDEERAVIENLKETIEETLNITIVNKKSSDVMIMQPNPNRYKMVVNGLRPRKHLEEFLKYVYTGKFNLKPKVLDDDHVEFIRKLDDMLSVIYLFNMTKLVEIIEVLLQPLLKEHTAMDLLQLASQYNLGKLSAKVVQYLRRPKIFNILNGIEDTMFYKCVISNSLHKNQSQFQSNFMMQAGKDYLFYLNGIFLIKIFFHPVYSSGCCSLQIKLKNKRITNLVEVFINNLELTVISQRADVEDFILKRKAFVVNSLISKIIPIMPYQDFLNKSYCVSNEITVKFFIEANQLDWI